MMKSQHNLSGLFRDAREDEPNDGDNDGRSKAGAVAQHHTFTDQHAPIVAGHEASARYRDTTQTLQETLEIGRATAEHLSRQGEQLSNAEALQYQTEYHLDKSARLLKGMSSWNGWFSNLISKDVQFQSRPDQRSTQSNDQAPSLHDVNSLIEKLGPVEQYTRGANRNNETGAELKFPKIAAEVVDSIQNYHIHILLLHEHCHTKQEYVSCLEACEKLQKHCQDELFKLRQKISDVRGGTVSTDLARITSYLAHNLELLNLVFKHYHSKWFPHQQQQSKNEPISLDSCQTSRSYKKDGCQSSERQELFSGKTDTSTRTPDFRPGDIQVAEGSSSHESVQMRLRQQEDHLQSLIPQLDELTQLSTSIHSTLQEQSSTVERMEQHADQLIDKTNHVKRRTHAMTQRNSMFGWSSWHSGPSQKNYELDMVVTIQHLPTKRYLSVMGGMQYTGPTKKHNSQYSDAASEGDGNTGDHLRSDTDIIKTNPTSLILTSSDQGDASAWLLLKDKRHSSTHKSDSWSLIGLQNALTKKYLGMNTAWFSGDKNGIVCASDRITTNEQWELELVADQEGKHRKISTHSRTTKAPINQQSAWTVRMLHVNANGGNGGYVEEPIEDESSQASPLKIIIGQNALNNGQSASLWRISRLS